MKTKHSNLKIIAMGMSNDYPIAIEEGSNMVRIGSSIFGVIGSLFQNKLKTFLAFSSISHIGFIFFALSSVNLFGLFSAMFYLIFYIFANFIFFGLILNSIISIKNSQNNLNYQTILYISDLKGIYYKDKMFGFFLIILLLCFAGVPPFITFFGKF